MTVVLHVNRRGWSRVTLQRFRDRPPPSRLRTVPFLGCLLWAVSGVGMLHAEVVGAEQGATQYVVPPAVQALLQAENDQGRTILGAEQRKYYDALPTHGKDLVAGAVDEDRVANAQDLAVVLGLGLSAQKFERLMGDNCVLCHLSVDYHDPETLFAMNPVAGQGPAHMNLENLVNDVHFRGGLSCAGCHGGDPTGFMEHDHPDSWPSDRDERLSDRAWIPEFCNRCHGDAAAMRQFAPAMPIDQFAKYKESHHGKLLLEQGDSRAAQCVSCHGTHGIRAASSPLSSVHPKNIPDTCGSCHADAEYMRGFLARDGGPIPTDQVAQYRDSVHGKALLERGDTGAATCNDCHGNHAAMPPEVSSVSQICRNCHAINGAIFDGSGHKAAFEEHGWPECETCHGKHDIAKTDDTLLAVGPGRLCTDCHEKFAGEQTEQCEKTADYFHKAITGLVAEHAHFTERAQELGELGLDIEPMEQDLAVLADALRTSRSYIHSFDRSDFDGVAEGGVAAVESLRVDEQVALQEFRERRRGLFFSMAMIGLLAVVLWLKLRQIEKRQSNGGDGR